MRPGRKTSVDEHLERLASSDPVAWLATIDDAQRNRIPYHPTITNRLVALLDDATVVTTRTVTRCVSDEAAKALGAGPHRTTLLAIEARIEQRGAAASERLWRALGALAPEGTWPLLAGVDHADAQVRAWCREALDDAVRRSDATGREAILLRAFAGLADEGERDVWSTFLTRGGPEAFVQRARALASHLAEESLARWSDAPDWLVRAVALTALACRARDPRVRAIVADHLVRELPRTLETPTHVDGRFALSGSEGAVHVLASWLPDVLSLLRREDARLDAVLRDHVRAELARVPGSTEPSVAAYSLARALAGDAAILDAALVRLEHRGALTAGLARLLDEQARALPHRRRDTVRRAILALPADGAELLSLARLASCEPDAFAEAASARLASSSAPDSLTDAALVVLAEALSTTGARAASALPHLAARAASPSASSALRATLPRLERAIAESGRRRAGCLARLSDADPATRIAAMDELRSGAVPMDDEIVAVLTSAREDTGVWTFRERDWDDVENEHAAPTRLRTRRVADVAAELLETRERWRAARRLPEAQS